MDIAQAHHIIDIRGMGLGCQRIPKENYKIDFIVFNLCPYLLFASRRISLRGTWKMHH